MRLVFKLYAGLADYLPAEAEKNATSLDLPDETTVNDIIDKFNVPRERAQLVLLNGVYLNPDERNSANLRDGDTLAIWPPIAGG